jgi:hypothetical protein
MSAPAKDPSKFVETDIDDETVVMVLDTGDFFSLADTARAIWRLIDGQRDRAAIVEALAADYAVPSAQIAAEVNAFLAELGEAGLLAQG